MRKIFQDNLTGIYNEEYIEERFEQEIIRANRYKKELSALLFEIDYGYFVKDRNLKAEADYAILKQFGKVILKVRRDVDLAGRVAGNLFMLILPETSVDDAAKAAERLRSETENYHFIGVSGEKDTKVAVNVGVVSYPKNGKTPRELMSEAKEALKEARERGGNKVVVRVNK